jgi:short-subunit dehydrogenase
MQKTVFISGATSGIGLAATRQLSASGMTDVLRIELAQSGIHIALIEPGAVDTTMRKALRGELHNLYASMIERMTHVLQQQAKRTVSVEQVADTIVHALSNHQQKTRYVIGISTVGLITMRKITPDSVVDALIQRIFGLHSSKPS